ncbi:MAG: CDP-diacylglycerol--glycerol-3-phosphate 3-phosphatidyltransferase [Deltaproteobacteria bacterium]|nr:CDP-diacylglycerol--glycerol-3-phosphate 3-phosphatidyltransferase [Deltaproteobacteria bacterium]
MKLFAPLHLKFWTLPNHLTLYRIVTIPVLVVLLLFSNKTCGLIAALVFSTASVTDFLDGLFARRAGLESTLGMLLDPVADKLMISAALIMLIPHGRVEAWMAFVIIGREIAITGLRGILSDKGVVMGAVELSKYKTGFQIAAIIPLLIHYPYYGIDFHAVGTVLLWIALILTVWSGVRYVMKYRRFILE